MRFLQRAAREHRRQVLAIGRRRMDVVDRLDAAAALAGVAKQRRVWRLADDRRFERARAGGRRAHAADRHRGARDPAGAVGFQQRRRRGDGEVAMPARELDEGITGARAHCGKRTAVRSSFPSIAGVI